MSDPEAVTLGQSIRARRIEMGLSQEELAEQLGIARKRISSIETGKLGTVSSLLEITEALGLNVLAAPRELRETRELMSIVVKSAHQSSASRVRRDRV